MMTAVCPPGGKKEKGPSPSEALCPSVWKRKPFPADILSIGQNRVPLAAPG